MVQSASSVVSSGDTDLNHDGSNPYSFSESPASFLQNTFSKRKLLSHDIFGPYAASLHENEIVVQVNHVTDSRQFTD